MLAGLSASRTRTIELVDGSLITGPPKSEAGKRTVSLPALVLPDITAHRDRYAAAGDDSLIFTGPKGAPLRRPNFSATWRRATEAAGLTGFHFHDLRHTGNHIAATTGASLRELMGRMGHSTTRAALVYQHRTTEREPDRCRHEPARPGRAGRQQEPIGRFYVRQVLLRVR